MDLHLARRCGEKPSEDLGDKDGAKVFVMKYWIEVSSIKVVAASRSLFDSCSARVDASGGKLFDKSLSSLGRDGVRWWNELKSARPCGKTKRTKKKQRKKKSTRKHTYSWCLNDPFKMYTYIELWCYILTYTHKAVGASAIEKSLAL